MAEREVEERARESAAEWFDREVWAEGDGGERPDQSVETYPYKQGFLAGYREGEGQANPSPAAVARVLREAAEELNQHKPAAGDRMKNLFVAGFEEAVERIEQQAYRVEAMIPERERHETR